VVGGERCGRPGRAVFAGITSPEALSLALGFGLACLGSFIIGCGGGASGSGRSCSHTTTMLSASSVKLAYGSTLTLTATINSSKPIPNSPSKCAPTLRRPPGILELPLLRTPPRGHNPLSNGANTTGPPSKTDQMDSSYSKILGQMAPSLPTSAPGSRQLDRHRPGGPCLPASDSLGYSAEEVPNEVFVLSTIACT